MLGGGGGQKELHTLQLTVTDQMAALNSYPQTGETALHLACKVWNGAHRQLLSDVPSAGRSS